MLNEHREEQSSLITKDLLGGLSCNSQESADRDFKDLNYPPEMKEKSFLDLKLESSCWSQSVCTLEKVKNALERDAEKERKRSSRTGTMFAAACPCCLLYVVTLKTNPKCPRCNSIVSSSLLFKKPKFDLNASSI
ncbi:hypothetical protein ACOSQ3_013310 [Xanthoceras sorbifolium]